ncbi:MAG: phosphoadenosine phosphosulfate reductase family protein, partial [Methylococcaceae bacterium]|nr:phosphoadenosine phosphosulfate reductase family protein [Methylococcaceae bacterium]
MTDEQPAKPVRHLLGLSGGKDSSALAIYLRDRVPEMEYFFADTGAELPETLAYIDMLEDYLGKT